MRNHIFRLGALALMGAWIAVLSGCGGNSTPVGITVSPVSPTILLGKQVQFAANVSGTATTTVTWQICLPPTPTNAQPTTCSPPATGQTQLPSGYGTITSGANGAGGGFYTAPTTLPPTNQFLVVATSTIQPKAFAATVVTITSGIGVTIKPGTATIAAGESVPFTATVNGGGSNVTWEVGGVAGGSQATGFISAAGVYSAPVGITPGPETITAVSASDPSKLGTATVVVVAPANPTVTSISPNITGEGSAQQDVYLTGTNFLSTSKVLVGAADTSVPVIFLSTTLLRATIPANLLAGPGPAAVPIFVQTQDGTTNSNVLPGPEGLNIAPTQPIVLASLPNTVGPAGGATNLNLIGGFFSPGATTVQFNNQTLVTNFISSRQLTATVPAGAAAGPGSYPVTVRNGDVVAPNPGASALNIAVEPSIGSIPSAPQSAFAVGTSPQSIAIDRALGIAVIVNKGSNNVSIVNLATKTPLPGSPLSVGHAPTSVAIDDNLLPDHLAVVTNSADNTLSIIDLTTFAVSTLALPNLNAPPNAAPVPVAIGINPLTHRGLVAIQQSNTADVVDFTNGVPTNVQSVGGTFTLYSTSTTPSVAVDPRLNWAISTPGSQGTINIVDLGHNPEPSNPSRPPSVVASLNISSTIQGIGINPETHQALLTDPNGGASQGGGVPLDLSTFSLLDQTVKTVLASQNGVAVNVPGFVAAAVNPLENIGIAVNDNGSAYVVDVANGLVLQTITGLNAPTAVAIDAVTNTAYVANSGNNTVSVVPLSTSTVNPLQIVESSPSTTYVQTPNTALTLTIVGSGFTAASKVVLDGTTIPTTLVSSRDLTASVSAAMLSGARGYVVYVENSSSAVSNITRLTVIEPIPVGTSPIAVAVDNARDQAVITNSASNDVSLVNLLTGTVASFPTGANPFGVAVLPRLGLAFVVNHGTNNATILDEAGFNGVFAPPVTVPLCGNCALPIGATINPDTAVAALTATFGSAGNFGVLGTVPIAGATPAMVPGVSSLQIDFLPLGLAVDPSVAGDPTQNITAVATAAGINQSTGAGTSALDFIPSNGGSIGRVSNLFLPTDVVFDPVNQVFLATDSTANNIYIVNPTTSILGTIAASINPTSLDYNYNTSALVAANSESSTVSIIDYVCPPNSGVNCPVPKVQTIFAAGSLIPSSAVADGTKAVGIDLRLNLIVEVDQLNNRVLLVPLSQ